jgi:outer membrane protein
MRATIARVALLTFFFSGFFPSVALSGERQFSLREAIEFSWKENPEIKAFDQGLLSQKEEIGIARSSLLPKITFEERFMRTNNPTYAFMAKLNQGRFQEEDFAIDSLNQPSPVNDFQTGLSFEQPLFAPKANIGVDMAKTEYSAKGAEVERKREEIAFRVFKTYLGVQTAKSFTGVAGKGVEDAKEHLRVAEARFNAGLGLYSDVLRATVALSSAEEKVVSAGKDLEVSRRALGLMLGLDESVDVDDERPSFSLRKLEEYYAASRSRKDLMSLERRYRNAGNALKMANAGYFPVIGIGGAYQLNDHAVPFGAEGDSWQLTAFLRWQLFDGTRREHERQKAKHTISETAEHLEGFRKQISFMVFDAFLGVDESRKGLELAKASVKSADEGKRLVEERYENSLSTMVDLLDVQTSLDSARANVVDKEAAYLISIANLAYQSGTLLDDLGLERWKLKDNFGGRGK